MNLSYSARDILKKSVPMLNSRLSFSLLALFISAFVYKTDIISAGYLLVAGQLVQVFVVASSRFFVGINIKSNPNDIKIMLKNYLNILAFAIIWGIILTILLYIVSPFYTQDLITLKTINFLAFGIIPLSIYGCNCTVLETIQKARYVFIINIITSAINVALIFIFYTMVNDALLSIVWSLTISRIIAAFLSILPLIKYIEYLKLNFSYFKGFISIGINESFNSIISVGLMTILIWLLSGTMIESEIAKLYLYFNILNFIQVTAMAIVTSITVNYINNEKKFLAISTISIFIYICFYISFSPLISWIIFSDITYFWNVIICVLTVLLYLLAKNISNRIRYIKNNSKIAYISNISVGIVLLFVMLFNIHTAANILMLFLSGEAVSFLICLFFYQRYLKKYNRKSSFNLNCSAS
ncbi:hypothetical protein [Bartonella sp. DGB1]|uniref:hypothetical protein n=1 Tax=Bartonella sp. DGB1 TaxID=3239807 RepID=UPI0035241CDA